MKRIWKPLLIIGSSLFVVWLAVYLILSNFDFARTAPVGILGLVFGVAAFVLTGLCLLLTGMKEPKNDSAYSQLPIALSAFFLLLTLSLNMTAMLIAKHLGVSRWLNLGVILVNVVLLGVSVAVMAYALAIVGRLASRGEALAEQQAATLNCSAELGKMLGMVSAPKAHAALLKLKETVDMSSNTTTADSAIREKGFTDVLYALQDKVITGRPEEEICELAETARRMWLARNAVRG